MPRTPCNPVDRHIGTRIRQRRKALGISMQALGTALGISYQQVQKYERGTNKIAASLLYEITRQLCFPVAAFYAGLDDDTPMNRP